MSESAGAGDQDDGEIVIAFGGESRTFHAASRHPTRGLRPRCGTSGRNPLEKQRELIESHYAPCQLCYPEAHQEGAQDD